MKFRATFCNAIIGIATHCAHRKCDATRRLLALLVTLWVAHGATATDSFVEGGGIYYDLTDGLASTYGEYLRARIKTSASDAWTIDITNLDRFDDDGTQFSGGNVHRFSDRWYTNSSFAVSDGGFFWPHVRVDGSVSRIWTEQKRLVTTIGAGYFDAKDIHEDTRVFIDASYYLPGPWVVHSGFQVNISEPGSVTSNSGYVAASYVKNKTRIMSIRGSVGDQAYQAVTVNNFVVDFPYHSVRATWREWVGKSWGINLAAEHYASDVYDQHGFELGFFKEF